MIYAAAGASYASPCEVKVIFVGGARAKFVVAFLWMEGWISFSSKGGLFKRWCAERLERRIYG